MAADSLAAGDFCLVSKQVFRIISFSEEVLKKKGAKQAQSVEKVTLQEFLQTHEFDKHVKNAPSQHPNEIFASYQRSTIARARIETARQVQVFASEAEFQRFDARRARSKKSQKSAAPSEEKGSAADPSSSSSPPATSSAFFCRYQYDTRQKTFLPFTLASVDKATPGKRKRESELSRYQNASARLQLLSMPGKLPCREAQAKHIYDFLKKSIEAGGSGSGMYISGMPGTGKTASVLQVIDELDELSRKGKLPEFDFAEINGMKLASPYYAYPVLLEQIDEKQTRAAPSRAAQLLENLFSKKPRGGERKPCVLLVDEMDFLVTRKQNVIYNLFDWPSRPHAHLIVVGIANTMDLPERLAPRVRSRLGMERLTFQSYTQAQLRKIVETRLGEYVDIFAPQSVEYASRKVASTSGDARRVLQVCSRAAEIRERLASTNDDSKSSDSLSASSSSSASPAPKRRKGSQRTRRDAGSEGSEKKQQVTIQDVIAARDSLFQASNLSYIKNLQLYQRLFIASVILQLRHLSSSAVGFREVHQRFKVLCTVSGRDNLSTMVALDIANRLADLKIIILLPDQVAYNPLVQLNVQEDDVCFALKDYPECGMLSR